MRRKIVARKNKSTDKIGMNAYFFRTGESECNGYEPRRLTAQQCCAYNENGL